MPTATDFKYAKEFSPDEHCVESKTTAQLDALNRPRLEDTLANIMAYWWNLYTVDVDITIGTATPQTRTLRPIGNANGGSQSDLQVPALTPSERVCAFFNQDSTTGLAAVLDIAVPLNDAIDVAHEPIAEDTYFNLWLKRVYYNTDTGLYALVFNYEVSGGPKGSMLESQPILATNNGGAVTVFGSSVYAGTRPNTAGYANISLTVSNPTYYTY